MQDTLKSHRSEKIMSTINIHDVYLITYFTIYIVIVVFIVEDVTSIYKPIIIALLIYLSYPRYHIHVNPLNILGFIYYISFCFGKVYHVPET